MTTISSSSFAFADRIRETMAMSAFDIRHERKVATNADMIRIEAEILRLTWKLEREQRSTSERDAKTACESERLAGQQLRLPDGAVVQIERHNGYVMSGWDSKRGWWAIDLRNDKATLVA